MTDVNNEDLNADDVQAELSSDEIKADILEKYGIDETENEELVNKLVDSKIEDNKKFSTVIRQKIDWRTKAEANMDKSKPTTQPNSNEGINADDFMKQMEEKFNQKFEERDLNDSGLSEEIRNKVKSYAKAEGVTVKVAMESDYVTYLKEASDNRDKADNASLGGRGKVGAKRDYTANPKFTGDLSTDEGKKEFKAWEAHMRTL